LSEVVSLTDFYAWLRTQRHREDAVGDLARDACSDRDKRRGSRRRPATLFRDYLEDLGACDGALQACEYAIAEASEPEQLLVTKLGARIVGTDNPNAEGEDE
jgi:hypothetical protein